MFQKFVKHREAIFYWSRFILVFCTLTLVYTSYTANKNKAHILEENMNNLVHHTGTLKAFSSLSDSSTNAILRNHKINHKKYTLGVFVENKEGDIQEFFCDYVNGETKLVPGSRRRRQAEQIEYDDGCAWFFQVNLENGSISDLFEKEVNILTNKNNFLYGLSVGEQVIISKEKAYSSYYNVIEKGRIADLRFCLAGIALSLIFLVISFFVKGTSLRLF